jgi:hypothetical protein
MTATLKKAKRPSLEIERTERPDISLTIEASSVATEPGESTCALTAATRKGQRHNMAASLLNAPAYSLVAEYRSRRLSPASFHGTLHGAA